MGYSDDARPARIMPYIRYRSPYRQKPPSGVAPNFAHPLAKDLVAFIPFTEGAGVPHAWIKGVRRAPDTNSLHSTAQWETRKWGRYFRPSTTNANSWLVWNNFPQLLTGDFTALMGVHVVVGSPGAVGCLSSGIYSPNYLASSSDKWRFYISSDVLTTTTLSAGDDSVVMTYRKSGDAEVEYSVDRAREGLNTKTIANSGAGNTLNLNAARNSGAFNAQEHFSYYWMAIWHRALPQSQRYELLHNQDAIWQIYSRPLPVWISSGAAPPAWNNSINEISAPGAVNEITNANIQSVNEI